MRSKVEERWMIMSFVSVFAMENFITVMSDGLVTNEESKTLADQRFKKFKKISPNQFVAVAGNQGVAQAIFDLFESQSSEYDLWELTNTIRDQILKEITIDKANCLVVLGGIRNNEIIAYSFSNDPNKEINKLQPKGNDSTYMCLSSDLNEIDPFEEMEKLLRRAKPKTPSAALKIQEELNTLIATYDSSVNRITFKMAIKKSQDL